MVGSGSRIRVASAGLVMAMAGCLSAPPDSTAPGDDDAGTSDGDAGSRDGPPDGVCTPFLFDDFDDAVTSATRFSVDETPPDSTVDISGGLARLRATGSPEVVGYASLRSLAAHEVASSALEVVFDVAAVSGDAAIIVAFETAGGEMWELGMLNGRLVISHDDGGGGEAEVLCDPCESFSDGRWRLRLEEAGNRLTFLGAPDSDPLIDLYPGGVPIVNQEVYARISLIAAVDTDMATADLDDVSWSLCE